MFIYGWIIGNSSGHGLYLLGDVQYQVGDGPVLDGFILELTLIEYHPLFVTKPICHLSSAESDGAMLRLIPLMFYKGL